MVDTPALGAGAVRREGSSPFIRTKHKHYRIRGHFTFYYLLIEVGPKYFGTL